MRVPAMLYALALLLPFRKNELFTRFDRTFEKLHSSPSNHQTGGAEWQVEFLLYVKIDLLLQKESCPRESVIPIKKHPWSEQFLSLLHAIRTGV